MPMILSSVVMIALIAEKGNIFDATVLTSIAEATVGLSAGLTALDIQIASEAAPELWCSYPLASFLTASTYCQPDS